MKKTLDHSEAPLYESLCEYEESKRASMHVPGHKDGRVFDQAGLDRFLDVLKIDVTATKGIDDLHHPADVIAQAQRLAADAFGADETKFLVGGSTVGNLAAALTVCSPGNKILVQRNMHKSVFNGLLLAGAKPIYIAPAIEQETKTAMVCDLGFIEKAMEEHPDIKGVWVTNPSYYGMSRNLAHLAKKCHSAGIPLIVDEAHGAHFGQSEAVPPSALSQGADMVIQSTHKMLTSLHMSSMVHVKGDLINRTRLSRVLGMIQSTSPSYVLLGSLDLARRYLVENGRQQLGQTAKRLEERRRSLSPQLSALTIWGGSDQVEYHDPLKWIIASKDGSLSGYELMDILHAQGATAEISDPRNLVFLFSINEDDMDIERVVKTIQAADKEITTRALSGGIKAEPKLFEPEGTIYEPEMSLHDAFYMLTKKVNLDEAEGELCAETVLPYPPGIPLLNPGEKIKREDIETMKQLHGMGAYFQNPSDSTMQTISIIDE